MLWHFNLTHEMNEFIEAVSTGNMEQCRRLLQDGVDVNAADAHGETALHVAVNHGHARIAALLLAFGADFRTENELGVRALGPDTEVSLLHRIRQEYQRLPAIANPEKFEAKSPEVRRCVAELERDGISVLRQAISLSDLQNLRNEFDHATNRLRWKKRMNAALRREPFYHYDLEDYWRPRDRIYVTNNALRKSPHLVEFCRRPMLHEIALGYLRKPAYIQRAQAMRYLPLAREEHTTQFGWHHDMEDKRVKFMVLLTDIGVAGQYMSYAKGSHVAYHPYERFMKNNLDFDYCRTYLQDIDIVDTIGRAGDVYVFDSNGMHRGVRNAGDRRDAYFIEFSADRNEYWGATFPRKALAEIPNAESDPFFQLRNATPKWEQLDKKSARTIPTWPLSLPDVGAWVWPCNLGSNITAVG